MKRIITLLCLMALFTGQKNFANYDYECYESYDSGCCGISYLVYVDYLRWKIDRPDNTSFTAFTGGTTHFFYMQPSYHPGYRVGAAIYCNCLDLGMRYTSLLNATDFARNTFTLAPGSVVGITLKFDYRVLDIDLGYTHFFQCHKGYVKPFVGAKLAWLREIHTLETVQLPPLANAFLVNASNINAYGPMIGIEGNWELFRCCLPISLIARGDVSILSANIAPRLLGTSPATITENDAFSFITVTDLFLGLGIDLYPFSCFDSNLQIGYEAQTWDGIFTGGVATSSTLGLGGVVARFSLMF